MFSESAGLLAETTILMSKRLILSVRVKVVMSLIMLVILVERIIQVTIDPGVLGDLTDEEGKLGVITWVIVVSGPDWVHLLVKIGVDELVTQVVMWLLPVILWLNG